MLLACAQKGDDLMKKTPTASKVTRAYLLARGFKESADQSGVFTLEHVRLRDVSRDLGFPLASLRPIRSQARVSEELTADVSGMTIIVESEVPYSENPHDGLLDNPDTICAATVAISTGAGPGNATAIKEYLQTKSSPRLHITSVLVPRSAQRLWRLSSSLLLMARHRWLRSKDSFRSNCSRQRSLLSLLATLHSLRKRRTSLMLSLASQSRSPLARVRIQFLMVSGATFLQGNTSCAFP